MCTHRWAFLKKVIEFWGQYTWFTDRRWVSSEKVDHGRHDWEEYISHPASPFILLVSHFHDTSDFPLYQYLMSWHFVFKPVECVMKLSKPELKINTFFKLQRAGIISKKWRKWLRQILVPEVGSFLLLYLALVQKPFEMVGKRTLEILTDFG